MAPTAMQRVLLLQTSSRLWADAQGVDMTSTLDDTRRMKSRDEPLARISASGRLVCLFLGTRWRV
jgi:hypothetical protein